MSNRTAGDDAESAAWGRAGMSDGSLAGNEGLKQYHANQVGVSSTFGGRRVRGEATSLEDYLGMIASLALGIFVGMAVAETPDIAGYWPWVAGLGSGLVCAKLLRGPLRFLLVFAKWVLVAATVFGFAYLIWR